MSPIIVPIAFIVAILAALAFVLSNAKRRQQRARAVVRHRRDDEGVGEPPPNARIGRGPTRRLDL